MPARHGFGRALGRDLLDSLLFNVARARGAALYQPRRATSLIHGGRNHALKIVYYAGDTMTLCAPAVIAAHGSWERGGLPTNLDKSHAAADLLGFKAHFRGASLAPGTMPLLAFQAAMAASSGQTTSGYRSDAT